MSIVLTPDEKGTPMNEDTEIVTPSKSLASALNQYCEELEALGSSIEMVTLLLKHLRGDHQKKLTSFIDANATDKTETDGQIKFSVDLDKRSELTKLMRRKASLDSSRRLIPRNFLVAMVCVYDSFLGKVLRFVLDVKPEILDASERTLTYSDLLEFKGIADAREHLIQAEIESVLRKSHAEHFKWLEAKLGTPFNKGLDSWPTFIELTERRNLFVHCDGVVSAQYLRVCLEHKCTLDPQTSLGAKLEVSPEYFRSSYQCLYEIGVKLAYVIWRKLLKAELKESDSSLIEVTYALLEKGNYDIAIRILEFFTQPQLGHFDESIRLVLLVNLAQAYKWSKNQQKCNEVLNSVDWSACENRFRLAVHVLRDEYEHAFKCMRKLVHDEAFHKVYYKEWPIFREFRKHADFGKKYEECYGEKFVIEERVTTPKEPSSDNRSSADNSEVSTS